MITMSRMVEAGTIGGVGLKITSVKGSGMPICPYLMMNCCSSPTKQRTERRARITGQAADCQRDQRVEQEALPHHVRQADRRRSQHAAQGCQPDAQGKDLGKDAPHVDAERFDHFPVLHAGADDHPQPGALEQQPHGDQDHDPTTGMRISLKTRMRPSIRIMVEQWYCHQSARDVAGQPSPVAANSSGRGMVNSGRPHTARTISMPMALSPSVSISW
jgi:hypothetical protein